MLDKTKPEAFKAGDFCIGSEKYSGLSKLIEEAGETLQVAGKLIATGGAPEHWDGTNLRERLRDELADLSAAISFFAAINELDDAEYYRRYREKYEQFCKWHREQKS